MDAVILVTGKDQKIKVIDVKRREEKKDRHVTNVVVIC